MDEAVRDLTKESTRDPAYRELDNTLSCALADFSILTHIPSSDMTVS